MRSSSPSSCATRPSRPCKPRRRQDSAARSCGEAASSRFKARSRPPSNQGPAAAARHRCQANPGLVFPQKPELRRRAARCRRMPGLPEGADRGGQRWRRRARGHNHSAWPHGAAGAAAMRTRRDSHDCRQGRVLCTAATNRFSNWSAHSREIAGTAIETKASSSGS